jgi:hypothetical protein
LQTMSADAAVVRASAHTTPEMAVVRPFISILLHGYIFD